MELSYPKISVVTPNYNGSKYLEHSIKSILDQGYPNLEYVIIDGDSEDGSIDIIKKYENQLSYWISEPDQGLYDALNKGFNKTTGEIMGWLNSDDMLHNRSLFTLAEIFSFNEVEWVQGPHSWLDIFGRTFRVSSVPLRSHYNYLMKDYHSVSSPFIQQESTFWKRSLWDRSGGQISVNYKLAGDFELWMRFLRYGKLYLTSSLIGGFRVTGSGQLSVDHYEEYLKEADDIIDSIGLSVEELKNIKFLSYRNFLDQIPFVRRKRFQKRSRLLNEFGEINWDTNSDSFLIK